jgi:hypothetical protein
VVRARVGSQKRNFEDREWVFASLGLLPPTKPSFETANGIPKSSRTFMLDSSTCDDGHWDFPAVRAQAN